MSGLNDAIEQLYSHFLLRDVLAKAIPGFLALLMLAAPLLGHHQERWLPFGRNLNWIAVLVIYGVGFLAGMMLQFLAQRIGLIQIHVWDKEARRSAPQVSVAKALHFMLANTANATVFRVRERFAILKEMTGSYCALAAMAAVLVLMAPLTRHSRPSVQWLIAIAVLGVIAFALAKQNRFHAMEQRVWETEATPAPSADSVPEPKDRGTEKRGSKTRRR
jgi:hypothetical protein